MALTYILFDPDTGTVVGFDPRNLLVVAEENLIEATGQEDAIEHLVEGDSFVASEAMAEGMTLHGMLSEKWQNLLTEFTEDQ